MGLNKINVNNTDTNYVHSIIVVNELENRVQPYESKTDARSAVPSSMRNYGCALVYKLKTGSGTYDFRQVFEIFNPKYNSFTDADWKRNSYWVESSYEFLTTLAKTSNCSLFDIFEKEQISEPDQENRGGYQNEMLHVADPGSTSSYGVAFYEVNPGDVIFISFYDAYIVRTYVTVGFVEEIVENAYVIQVGEKLEEDGYITKNYYYIASKHGFVSVSYFNVSSIIYASNIHIYKVLNALSNGSIVKNPDNVPTPNSKNFILSGNTDDGIDDAVRLLPEYLYKTIENFYKVENVSNTVEVKEGYYVNYDKIVSHAEGDVGYGSFQVPVVKGGLYLFDIKYAINDPAYHYGGFCCHRQSIDTIGKVDYFYDYCYGIGSFKRFFLARRDGYISSFNVNLQLYNAPIVKKINLDEQDSEKLINYIYPIFESPDNKSKSFMDYLKWFSPDINYVNNVSPLEQGIFDGNVSRIVVDTDEILYPLGYFHSDKYGDTAWIDVLKQYQIQDDGVPLTLYLKARIYNAGSTIAQINFSVRYKEGGDWIVPGQSVELNIGEYKDVTISFTPNYNSLSTVLDSYIYFKNDNGAVLEFGNWDLYVIDPKCRDPKAFIDSRNIKSGITYSQLDSALQSFIDSSSSNRYPALKKKIICSGSSITWGGGALDDSMVKHLDYFIRQKLSDVVLASNMIYSGDYTSISNAILYRSSGRMISTLNETIEFDIFGDEIAICQMKKRTKTDYGIIEVYANDTLIGKFDNRNFIMSETEQFSGQNIRTIRLKHPCTFNHNIVINGTTTLSKIVYNDGGYGGTVPADQSSFDAFVFRSLDSNGQPVHKIQFSTALGTITSVQISYDYGHIEAYERNTLGQTADPNTNESYYGEGSISYDPDHPASGLSSGMEFRAVNKNAFFVHQFDTTESRRIKIKLVGGNNPYFIINFATNRYHDLMNAGIGGWTINELIDNNKNCDYTQFFKWFKPDLIFQESETNDDWSYSTRRINRSIGEITLEQLRQLFWLEVHTVTYNSNTNKYAVGMCTGIITSITPTSLISSDIVNTSTQVGDIIRIGNYHGDIKQFACRKLTEVNTTTGEVKWVEPLCADEILNIDSLDDLVGAEINIRDLSGYKTNYKNFIEKVHAITPEARIIVVDNGFPMLGLRQLWGYDVIHREIVRESVGLVDYLDARSYLYDGEFNRISGSRKEIISVDGSSEYTISFEGSYKSWCGFKVLVNGIDVYGKDCYVQCQGGYRAKTDLSGSSLNKSHPYIRSNATDSNSPAMKLVFTRNIPSVGDTVEVWFADDSWSGDYCHPSNYGAFLYAQAYASML